MKEGKYIQRALPRIRSGNISYTRYLNLFAQNSKALYGDAMFVSLSGVQMWPPETNRNICFLVFQLMSVLFA